MSVSDEQVLKVAKLARLAIDADRVDHIASSMNDILGLVDQIQAVDTDSVQPMAHPLDISQPTRRDEVTETDQRALVQKLAPDCEQGLYLVPRVIE